MPTARDMLKKQDQTKEVQAKPPVLQMLDKMSGEIKKALHERMSPDRYIRVVTTEIRRNPKLMECDPMTVIGSVMLAAQMGMEPGLLGHCFLIPRWNKKTSRTECSFQLGYKGMLELAHRSGEIADITAECVHENDSFHRTLGDKPEIFHEPVPWGSDRQRGQVIGYYAVVRTKNGGTFRACMSKGEVLVHAQKFSEAYRNGSGPRSGPWAQNFDEMALKTVLSQALKLAPKSTAFMAQVESDGLIRRNINTDLTEPDDEDVKVYDTEALPEDDDGADQVDVPGPDGESEGVEA